MKYYIILVIALIPFTFTYNSTLVDLYKECLLSNDCMPDLYVRDMINIDYQLTNAILVGIILMFSVSLIVVRHLTR